METGELILASQVHEIIRRYMQADGLDLVLDLKRSRGTRLYDAKSGEYFLDFFSCFATAPLGFNHPRMTSREVVERLGQAAIHKPSNSDVYSQELAQFVDAFGRLARPDFMKYLFFVEGGTLGVENALKAAFDWKVRRNLARGSKEEKGHQVIHFRQAFHGRSGYTLSLTNTADLRKTQYFPKFNWPRVTNPACTFPMQGENLERVRRLEERALAEIYSVIEGDPEDIACIILEPIQGEGGDNHFRPEFHRELRRICDEHDILFVYDEVQTGLGSTGRMWAFEHYVKPDLLAFGKKTQVCGFMASERLDEVADNVFHVSSRINSTWGGNLVDMLRCRLYLEIIHDDKLVEHAARLGAILLDGLHRLQQEFPSLLSNSRGLGLLCAFDLPDADTRQRLRRKLFENRLLVLACGERSIRFRSALNITEDDIDLGLGILRRSLQEL